LSGGHGVARGGSGGDGRGARSVHAAADAAASSRTATATSSSSSPPSAPVVDPADERFHTELVVAAIRAPTREIGGLMAAIKKHTLDRPRLNKVIADVEERTHSLILLSEASCAAGAPVDDYPPAVTEALAKTPSATLTTHVMHLGYDALSAEEALRRIIPPGIVIPVGFETVGRVAHLNLREEHEPYKAAVAAVLVDKLKQIEVVVNKTGETGGPYRTFDMEVLAGAPKNDRPNAPLETEVNENGLLYKLDFRAMYWNSRLGTERQRLVDSFSPDDVVLDLCAGVGPIALLAARKCERVYANDLNPKAIDYLRVNDQKNGKPKRRLAGITCLDARDAVELRVSRVGFDADGKLQGVRFTQAVMNLPQGSLELLDCFKGAFTRDVWPPEALPRINVYAFSKHPTNPEGEIGGLAAQALGLGRSAKALGDGVVYRRVRLVAPGKHMMFVSFVLPEKAAYKTGYKR
jgi:tRNA (guanine37-N1)-methyltransferase